MLDFSGISSGFFRPEIGGVEGLQRARAAQQVAQVKEARALPPTAAPSAAAKTDAAYWVNYAESRIEKIGESMRIYNHVRNRPSEYFREMEAEYGADFVRQMKESDELVLRGSEMTMAAHDMSIRANFDVTGTIYEKNAAGDYQFGKFTINRAGAGFAIHIDSEEGTRVAFNRGRFSGRFSRAELLDFDRLPFNNHGERRTDLIA